MASLHKKYPLLVRFVVWIGLPLVLLLTLGLFYGRLSLPVEEGRIVLAGLTDAVKIISDEHGVPHIFAKTDHDAFFALGYVHAQNRLWQMESQRRFGQGRLSEVLGKSLLQTDKFMRTLGLYRVAQENLRHLDTNSIASLEAYAAGVNAWIDEQHVLPVEFHVLGFRPEPWQPQDSLLQIKLMALNLDRNYRLELAFSSLTKSLGVKRASQLRAGYPQQAVRVTEESGLSQQDIDRLAALNERTDRLFRLAGEAAGSNAWVISGQYTQSGKPMLANDPHLKTQLPSIWYLAELHGDKLHVSGATIPGLPLVLTGHNAAIAWGVTALNADSQDIFLERTHVENDNLYQVDGQWEPVSIEKQQIRIRADFPELLNKPLAAVTWAVRSTRHGPLISDALGKLDAPMALKWCALKADDISYSAFLGINYAQDWGAFRAALEMYTAPTLNFVYADKNGNIGYAAGGEVPLRRSGDGSLPVPAWTSEFDWVGVVPRSELPHSFNPPSGYIVTANNQIHDNHYPYFISRDWAPGYRAEQITSLIADKVKAARKLTVADLIRMQGDQKNLQAAQVLRLFLSVSPTTARQQQAVEYLRHWDLQSGEQSIAASIYHAWLRRFSASILEQAMKADALHQQRDREPAYDRIYPIFLSELAAGRMQDWCDIPDTVQVESCSDRALSSLDAALKDLGQIGGGQMDDWQWGKVHSTHYPHSLFTNIKVLDSIFDRSIGHAGDAFTVDVASAVFSKEKGFQDDASASYRQVLDVADWSRSYFINNTGQSGNVFSRHYDDFVPRHQELRLVPMTFGAAGLRGKTLLLLPASKRS
jgi:penicillin G amidase